MVLKTSAPWLKRRVRSGGLTNYQIADELGKTLGIGRAKGYKVLKAFYSAVAKGLREDGQVKIAHFGKWKVRMGGANTGLNPGFPHYTPPRLLPSFKAYPQLYDLVQEAPIEEEE